MDTAAPKAQAWGRWQRVTPIEQLLVDDQDNLGGFTVTAYFAFHGVDTPVDLDWVKANFGSRLLVHPRFRARLRYTRTGRARFEALPYPPNLALHITSEGILKPGAPDCERDAEFRSRVDALISEGLPLDRPLWALNLFPGYAPDVHRRQGATLVFRMHHAIADGVGMVKFCLMHVADRSPGDDLSSMLVKPHRHKPNDGVVGVNAGTDGRSTRSAGRRSLKNATGAIQRCLRICQDFLSVFMGPGIPDPRTVLNTTPPSALPLKRQAFMRCISPSLFPFEMIRSASKRLGVSINDVFCTAIAGTLRQYLLRYGGDSVPFPTRLRVGFAINNHDVTSAAVELSNLVVVIPLRIPVGTADRYDRLRQLNEVTTHAKSGNKASFAALALQWLSLLPRLVRFPIFSTFSRSVSSLASNVPGPPHVISVGGVQIDSISVSAPVPDLGAGVTFTLFTYASNCSLSISGNSHRILYPSELVDMFVQELVAVCNLTQISELTEEQAVAGVGK